MAKQKDRVIIDTNLWINFLLTSDYSKLDNILLKKELTLLFSQDLLSEFIEVCQRPKFKKYFSANDVQILLTKIAQHATFIEVESDVNICRDFKDNFLLTLAKDGKATHLITGDKDILELIKFGKTKIITMTAYLSGQ
jgi:putative PIN family toxin of toxin-antitoxin system